MMRSLVTIKGDSAGGKKEGPIPRNRSLTPSVGLSTNVNVSGDFESQTKIAIGGINP